MYDTISAVEEYMPKDKPRYLMGVGTPSNIIESVARGVDFFDCVMPARNGRHGHLFTWGGIINIKNEKYQADESPIDPECSALCADAIPARISGICSRRKKCSPCALRSCTISTSITLSLSAYATVLTTEASSSSDINTQKFWIKEFKCIAIAG